MPSSKVIGEGSYGCVHKPALKCKNKDYDPDPNIVSKLLTTKNANDELKEFKLIKKADNKEDFYLGQPDSCELDRGVKNKTAIDSCNRFDSNRINNYKLLLLKNGGADLSGIEQKYKSMPENRLNTRKMEEFWLDMSRILYGSKMLIDKQIVHHDLKQQNIVYNDETGRVNFIDFGLMTTILKMKNSAKKNKYPYGIHWSFPAEVILYNNYDFRRLLSLTGQDKLVYIRNLFREYYTYAFGTVKQYMHDSQRETNDELKSRIWTGFYRMCMGLAGAAYKDSDYELFLKISMETLDNFGIGFSLLSMLIRTKNFIDKRLVTDLTDLFTSMVHSNVFLRPSPTEVVTKYETILWGHGLLDKYNMRFENHLLVDGSIKEQAKNDERKMPKATQRFLDELILTCPTGKELNPKTNRCINVCKKGFERNEQFLCRKKKTRKSTQKTKSSIKCPEGKELNPFTKRCNKTCKRGYRRNGEFKCVK
jgi:serine/threonine protein kinase